MAAELPDPIVSVYWASSLTFSQGDACLEERKERSRLGKKKQVLFSSSSVNETRVTDFFSSELEVTQAGVSHPIHLPFWLERNHGCLLFVFFFLNLG